MEWTSGTGERHVVEWDDTAGMLTSSRCLLPFYSTKMTFVLVFLQELIQGKGVVQRIQEGDPTNIAGVIAFVLATVGLTGWLALQGDDDYFARDL